MVSLTTIYGSAAAIGTVAAFLAAYVGHTIYPIQTGGSVQSVIETVKQKTAELVDTVTKPAAQPLNTDVAPLEPPVEEQPLPSLSLENVVNKGPAPSAPPAPVEDIVNKGPAPSAPPAPQEEDEPSQVLGGRRNLPTSS